MFCVVVSFSFIWEVKSIGRYLFSFWRKILLYWNNVYLHNVAAVSFSNLSFSKLKASSHYPNSKLILTINYKDTQTHVGTHGPLGRKIEGRTSGQVALKPILWSIYWVAAHRKYFIVQLYPFAPLCLDYLQSNLCSISVHVQLKFDWA